METPNTPQWQAQCLAEFDVQAASASSVPQTARTDFANWLANLAYALSWACVLTNIQNAIAGLPFTIDCDPEDEDEEDE